MSVGVPAFLGWVLVRVSGLLGIDVVLARFIWARDGAGVWLAGPSVGHPILVGVSWCVRLLGGC